MAVALKRTFLLYAHLALVVFILAAVTAVPVAAAPVASRSFQSGAGFIVTTTVDEFNTTANGTCSLREAVYAVDQNLASFGGCTGGPASAITLPAGTHHLSIPASDSGLWAASGDLGIHRSMTIRGAGIQATTIQADAGFNDRIMQVRPDVGASIGVTISDLKLTGGSTVNLYGGGAILNGALQDGHGSLTLDHVAISGNDAGDIYPYMTGGGITNLRGFTLTVKDSVIEDNFAGIGGGIYSEGVLTVINSTVQRNTARSAGGGIDFVPHLGDETATITGSTITANTATSPTDPAVGGAGIVTAGSLTLQDSSITNNLGTGLMANGGPVVLDNTIVSGNYPPEHPGSSLAGIAGIQSSFSLSLQNGSRVEKNHGVGLAVSNGSLATLNQSTLDQNEGAGLAVGRLSSVGLTDTTISGTALNKQGNGSGIDSTGILTLLRGSIVNNLGVGLKTNAGSTVEASRSTFDHNSGAGLLVGGQSSVTLLNSTVSGTVLDAQGSGSGIETAGSLTLQDSQIAGNQGFGLNAKAGSIATVVQSILDKNTGAGLLVNGQSQVNVLNSAITGTLLGAPGSGSGIEAAGSVVVQYSIIAGNAGAGLKANIGSAASLGNVTVSANAAAGVDSSGVLNAVYATIADNTGGGIRLAGGSASVRNTLLARQGASNCVVDGAVTTAGWGYNLAEDWGPEGANHCPFDVSNGDLEKDVQLAAQPGDNGGPTQTYALGPGSPAVDAIPRSDPTCAGSDQRWYGRPGAASGTNKCDIGAFESDALPQPHFYYYSYFPLVKR